MVTRYRAMFVGTLFGSLVFIDMNCSWNVPLPILSLPPSTSSPFLSLSLPIVSPSTYDYLSVAVIVTG